MTSTDTLLKDLLRLLHGDKACCYRLIEKVRRSHPQRSMDWCIEKVIQQLQQDRA